MIFRCDATGDTGLGHLSRCLGLAEALDDAGRDSTFAGHYAPGIADWIRAAGFRVMAWSAASGSRDDARALAQLSRTMGAPGILADDYRFTSDWVRVLADAGCAPVLFDDFGALTTYEACAGVINFGFEAAHLPYPGLAARRLLAGPGYFPARRHLMGVRCARSARAAVAAASRILVLLGARDRRGTLWPLLSALSDVAPDATIRALTPPEVIASAEAAPFRHALVPTTSSPAEHFTWADVCVSAGGHTKYECAYVGLAVAPWPQTEAEHRDTASFLAEGLGYDLGTATCRDELARAIAPLIHEPDRRAALIRNGLARFRSDSAAAAASAILAWQA